MVTPQVPTISVADFMAKWNQTEFGERQAAQPFFDDICRLVGHPTTSELQDPENFTFEKWVPGGFADAYLFNRFGWEFKGEDARLPGAFQQLLRYQVHLKTPPLLIVSSFNTIRIQTNFPGMETVVHEINVAQMDQQGNLDKLRAIFFNPEELKPKRTVADVTRNTAQLFHDIVVDMEEQTDDPEKLARYLNRIVFCLYAEDADLLPDRLFTRMVFEHRRDPATFNAAVASLFGKMSTGGLFGMDRIDHFNGDLFHDNDVVELTGKALQRLGEAADQNWRNIEPSIFGTLFERALNASKRAKLGAHYTGNDDIMLIVEPVVVRPLRREWEATRSAAERMLAAGDRPGTYDAVSAFRARLASATVLDPACGSGNFLYIVLKAFLGLEKEAILFLAEHGWHNETPQVGPSQMMGLEISHYAAELARTALWIGYIQWHQSNGFPYRRRPVLACLDTIRQTDALLRQDDNGATVAQEWPPAEFIIGNPPFLGNKRIRQNLGGDMVKTIYETYAGKLPRGSDLCCYWFEQARQMIEQGKARRAGLLGTQGIRGGANQKTLQRINQSGRIFMAYPDQPWLQDGAAVRTSMVGFDDGSEKSTELDGQRIFGRINADLTATKFDLTTAKPLVANRHIAMQGFNRVGNFDVPYEDAQKMMSAPNPTSAPNSDVLKPYCNAKDILDKPRRIYTIDFGNNRTETEAALYELPFEWLKSRRSKGQTARGNWWQYQLPSNLLRDKLVQLPRYLVTGRVSKHHIVTWLDSSIMPDNALVLFTWSDDYHLGILQSRVHELWSRAMGTQLEGRPRYTPSTCFDMFPLPEPSGEIREAVASTARRLYELREGWLNPKDAAGNPALTKKERSERTLTKLYNRRPDWLTHAHSDLDQAVADAYGWSADLTDNEILGNLLVLNRQRADAEDKGKQVPKRGNRNRRRRQPAHQP